MSDDANEAVDQLARSASHDTVRQLYSRLNGLLWHAYRSSGDPAAKEALATERAALRDRYRALVPGSADVSVALGEWGSRVRQLDRP